ncbi:MAG: radical SAM protein [Clostridia bacterium]|nr:radical SAM protein [Clostridia bacterium]MDD4542376.1 radical SAM protein [Clostridia bacterium]
MIFYDNIIISTNGFGVMMNMFSGRRKAVDSELLKLINSTNYKLSIEEKLSKEEEDLLQKLYNEKQILKREYIEKLDKFLIENDPYRNEKKRNMEIYGITFLLSFKCNISCSYCYQKSMNKVPGVITKEYVSAAIEFLNWYGDRYDVNKNIDSIVISGGEPLLEENIETINYIIEKFCESKITLRTNGVKLKKYFDSLLMNYIDTVTISLDGEKDVHLRRIEGNLDYDDIIDGIKMVLKHGIHVRIACVIDKTSYKTIPNFIDYLKAEEILGNENCEIHFGTVLDVNEPDNLHKGFNNVFEVREMIEYVYNTIPEYSNVINFMPELDYLSRAFTRPWNTPFNCSIRGCAQENPVSMMLLPNGEISYCDYFGKKEQIIGTYYPKNSFDIDKLHNFAGRSIYDFENCRECIFRIMCKGGCPKYQNFNGHPMCGILKNEYIMNNLSKFLPEVLNNSYTNKLISRNQEGCKTDIESGSCR